MDITGILAGIDQEINRLTQARALLAGQATGKRRGRPVGSGAGNGKKVAGKRKLSAAGRARIAEAMRARWAKKKAGTAKKAA